MTAPFLRPDRTFHAAFNARWIEPEEVAQRFVPTPHFNTLLHARHSALLGPRGSGKTTLLKMLTRRAVAVWTRRNHTALATPPSFEAVYFPSDVRWSYELRQAGSVETLGPNLSHLCQRALVAASLQAALLEAFEAIVGNERTSLHSHFCKDLIDLWGVKNRLPSFADLTSYAETLAADLRGLINLGNRDQVGAFVATLPPRLLAHVLDLPTLTCRTFDRRFPGRRTGSHWALCFDELEIAPEWLRFEILESLRSVDQLFWLKVTYTPLLPTGLRTKPEPAQDFQVVRLWNSHVEDSTAFCEGLATSVLQQQFPDTEVTPSRFLGKSELAASDLLNQGFSDYERGGRYYELLKSASQEDAGLALELSQHGISPEDPHAPSAELRDTLLRKIKPIVILRSAFRTPTRMRSRKVVRAYAGEQAVYAMSEGNPRWLMGLLSDLVDAWRVKPLFQHRSPYLQQSDQSRILTASAFRYHTGLAAAASKNAKVGLEEIGGLAPFLDAVGESIRAGLLGDAFPVDPVGGFYVDGQPSELLLALLEKGLELGAIVSVGPAEGAVPVQIIGSRFRLSFMLAPKYRLPFRNYREVALGGLLSGVDAAQLNLFHKVGNRGRDSGASTA